MTFVQSKKDKKVRFEDDVDDKRAETAAREQLGNEAAELWLHTGLSTDSP